CGRCPDALAHALLPFFELQVLELDVEQLRLQPHVPAGHRAILPGGGDSTVDPDADVPALAGHFIRVPRARVPAQLVSLPRNHHPPPALQILARHQIDPAGRVDLEGTLPLALFGGRRGPQRPTG